MFTIAQLNEEQFIRPATLEAIKHEAFSLIDHLMAPEGDQFAEQIERKLNSLPDLEFRAPEVYWQYQKLVVYLKLMALMCLDNDIVLDLVQNHYLDSLEANIDINDRMTGKMYTLPVLVWLEYTEQLIHALKQNMQRIGEHPIIKLGETTPSAPTIQNWISDYDRNLGPEKVDDLHREDYLARNPNAALLSETEKAKLRNVLQFYDNLKPIPASLIDREFKRLGIYEELAKEFPEVLPAQEFPAPSLSSEYRVHQELGQDRYLEPAEVEEIPRYRPPARPSPSGYGGQAPVPQSRYQPSSPSYVPPTAPPPTPPPPPAQPPNVLNLKEQQYRPSPPPPPAPPKSPYLERIESIETTDHIEAKEMPPRRVEASEAPIMGPPTYAPQPVPPFAKGRVGGISEDPLSQIHPTPPLQKEGVRPAPPPSAPPRPPLPPEPRLDGNIVDLKTFNNE